MTGMRRATAVELWRSSLVLAQLAALAAAVLTLGHMQDPARLTLWQDLQLLGVSGGVAAALLIQRGRPRAMLCAVAFLLVVASAIVTMSVNQHQLAESRRFFPLMGHKAVVLVIGMTAASVLLGLVAIAAVVLAGTLQATVFAAGAAPGGEPLFTALFAVVAAGVLIARMRARSAERTLATVLAEAEAAQRVARMCLAIRDLANTPLQTLVMSADLLEIRAGEDPELIARMKRALAQLARLNDVLATVEARLRSDPAQLAGFDPWQELAKHLGTADDVARPPR